MTTHYAQIDAGRLLLVAGPEWEHVLEVLGDHVIERRGFGVVVADVAPADLATTVELCASCAAGNCGVAARELALYRASERRQRRA